MNYRQKALELADDAMERIETGSTMPDTQDVMAYALIYALADIAKQLESIRHIIGLDTGFEYVVSEDENEKAA